VPRLPSHLEHMLGCRTVTNTFMSQKIVNTLDITDNSLEDAVRERGAEQEGRQAR
jgi:hypothetical protein